MRFFAAQHDNEKMLKQRRAEECVVVFNRLAHFFFCSPRFRPQTSGRGLCHRQQLPLVAAERQATRPCGVSKVKYPIQLRALLLAGIGRCRPRGAQGCARHGLLHRDRKDRPPPARACRRRGGRGSLSASPHEVTEQLSRASIPPPADLCS